ncbi:MAG: hypothetical protein Q7K45_01895, partial [Nanoarchaeota archaeon]|nr:hypothetical protein [Nanoarchaeota archaeon]
PQAHLVKSNTFNYFHIIGNRIDTEEGKPVLVTIEAPDSIKAPQLSIKSDLRLPMYDVTNIEPQRELYSHIVLDKLPTWKVEEGNENFCPENLSRYFVRLKDTIITVCADKTPTHGLVHRIDYFKDEIGQPTYRVE